MFVWAFSVILGVCCFAELSQANSNVTIGRCQNSETEIQVLQSSENAELGLLLAESPDPAEPGRNFSVAFEASLLSIGSNMLKVELAKDSALVWVGKYDSFELGKKESTWRGQHQNHKCKLD